MYYLSSGFSGKARFQKSIADGLKTQGGIKMRKKYYRFMPRNFGNEYDLISVASPDEEKELLDWYQSVRMSNTTLQRVTLADIRKLNATERHRSLYDKNFSGYCDTSPVAWSTYREHLFLDYTYEELENMFAE